MCIPAFAYFLCFLWNRILRKDEVSSDIHFFSTQFFQKIQDQGVDSVAKWTARRKINIFEKKFVFIPINDYLHWSLCVVVNPGKIENAYNDPNENMSKNQNELMHKDSNETASKDLNEDETREAHHEGQSQDDSTSNGGRSEACIMKKDAPFLLFFDSLKCHSKHKVHTRIIDWLNSEAKRLNRFQGLRNKLEPFWKKSMPLYQPKGKRIKISRHT